MFNLIPPLHNSSSKYRYRTFFPLMFLALGSIHFSKQVSFYSSQ